MGTLTVGLVYDLLGSLPARQGDPVDADAEYEPEETIELLEAALRHAGHRTVRLGSPHQLLTAAGKGEVAPVDAVLNIAEGRGSRNREAWAPVLLEMLGLPTLGSDALTLSLTLDKAWAKAVLKEAGVPVTPHAVVAGAEWPSDLALPGPFPLFVKPRAEGTAKGITPCSRVEGRLALEREVRRVSKDYAQGALVEPFLSGPEYTVTLVGNDPPRALPVLQRALEVTTGIGLHALERHASFAPVTGWQHCTPGTIDPSLERTLEDLAVLAWQALQCRDFARADFRLDGEGRPYFLEMNPLPTFAVDGSFAVHAELAGQPLPEFLAGIFGAGLGRLGLV